jgi:hypothetical protein
MKHLSAFTSGRVQRAGNCLAVCIEPEYYPKANKIARRSLKFRFEEFDI